jgi:hypothetical protein
MVIRDLTLRSAASFGSFHLIRLLYDEYMFYLVEHRVAQATGQTPISVMGEVRARRNEHVIYIQTHTHINVTVPLPLGSVSVWFLCDVYCIAVR